MGGFGTSIKETDLVPDQAHDGEGDVGGLGGVESSGAGVVGAEGGDDSEVATSLVHDGLAGEGTSGEEGKGDEEEEEDGREGERRLVGGEEHDEGEDEPRDQLNGEIQGSVSNVAKNSNQ